MSRVNPLLHLIFINSFSMTEYDGIEKLDYSAPDKHAYRTLNLVKK